VPGTSLKPTAEDDRVPVILVRRPVNLDDASESSSTIAGWRLYVPWHFSLPFFVSLVYSPVRVGGLQQHQQQSFEAGEPHFPRDWPPTSSCLAEEERDCAEMMSHWERKPPGKRENFEKLGTDEPFRPNWHALLKTDGDDNNTSTTEADAGIWLLRGALLKRFLERLAVQSPGGSGSGSDAQGILDELIAQSHEKRFGRTDGVAPRPVAPIRKGLVRVRVSPCGRGAPEDLAVIYGLEQEEWENVRTSLREKRERKAKASVEQDDVEDVSD
jgi:ribonuclease P/MRP protein subunit POP1